MYFIRKFECIFVVNTEGLESCMGRYGYGERNERAERLIEFAMKNELLIANTRFQQKSRRKWA